jgi:hypothetical protein
MSKEAVKMVKEGYELHVNYDEESAEKKLMKFVPVGGEPFVISADEMMSILVGQVNAEVLSAAFVESDRINVVDVMRQLRVRADRNIKKGEEIRLDYYHPYPLEFAVIEEAAKLAKIQMDVPMMTLTVDYIKSAKDKIMPEQKRFIDFFYKFFKDLKSNRAGRRAATKT